MYHLCLSRRLLSVMLNKFRYHRASIGMTKMTMTKNNSAAAEIAPPNCHVAVVPQSNCAVDVRTSRSRVIHRIFPTFLHFCRFFVPCFQNVAPKRSQSPCVSCRQISRGHAVESRFYSTYPVSTYPLPSSLFPARDNLPLSRGQKASGVVEARAALS